MPKSTCEDSLASFSLCMCVVSLCVCACVCVYMCVSIACMCSLFANFTCRHALCVALGRTALQKLVSAVLITHFNHSLARARAPHAQQATCESQVDVRSAKS